MIKTGLSNIFENKQGHKFEISSSVIEQMVHFIQNFPDRSEAGGVMLGRFIINSKDVVVDKITAPMKGDIKSRFRFFRSKYPHQARIDEEWTTSCGTCNYLGEWHTHPEPTPAPSLCDMSDWKKKLLLDSFDSDFLFFVIVGTEQINAWQGIRKKLSINQLTPII
jgi:integrative and conjugative element protein (TIGR02256 family)